MSDKNQYGDMSTGLILCVTTYKKIFNESNLFQPIEYLSRLLYAYQLLDSGKCDDCLQRS
jgi:hypothetical protein